MFITLSNNPNDCDSLLFDWAVYSLLLLLDLLLHFPNYDIVGILNRM